MPSRALRFHRFHGVCNLRSKRFYSPACPHGHRGFVMENMATEQIVVWIFQFSPSIFDAAKLHTHNAFICHQRCVIYQLTASLNKALIQAYLWTVARHRTVSNMMALFRNLKIWLNHVSAELLRRCYLLDMQLRDHSSLYYVVLQSTRQYRQ